MPSNARHDLLVDLLSPVASAAGFDLEDVEVAQVGRRSRIRVLVDKDGGVSLDECAILSRTVGETLDSSDEIGDEPYTLEVSSPGVHRPLTHPRHWRRNIGRLVAVTLRSGGSLEGRVRGSDDKHAVLEVGGKRREVAYSDVAKAKVQVEFKKLDSLDDAHGDDLGSDEIYDSNAGDELGEPKGE